MNNKITILLSAIAIIVLISCVDFNKRKVKTTGAQDSVRPKIANRIGTGGLGGTIVISATVTE